MVTASAPAQRAQLAAWVRQRLVSLAAASMESLLPAVQEHLSALMNEAASSRDMQLRRDAWMGFQRSKSMWLDGTVKAWQAALSPVTRPAPLSPDNALELEGTQAAENKIFASRLALGIMEKAAQEVNDMRRRLRSLNNDQELSNRDVAHPEILMLPLVEQWEESGLARDAWHLVSDVAQRHFNEHLKKAYALCNADMVKQGVLPVIDYSARQSPKAPPTGRLAGAPDVADAAPGESQWGAMPASAVPGSAMAASGRRMQDWAAAGQAGEMAPAAGWRFGRAQGGVLEHVGRVLSGVFQQGGGGGVGNGGVGNGGGAPVAYTGPSAPLMVAMAQQPRLNEVYFVATGIAPPSGYPVVMDQIATDLMQQSTELKDKAQTDNEKAIIELVALMFQSILQEDRIPTGVRVWFARLQMPVLRVALAEPDFFNKLDHPARQLIDHMGSCVMGFDSSGISSAAMETEIKRVVQVIEQYPETGDKVYKRVYEEFQIFLKKHLTQTPKTQKVLGVAQQVEQKETLAIQYTIELRNQLKDMPVRDEIREFLYKVWAEVLAVSAIRQGGQHEETLLLKKTATDLIWSASAKPNRSDRARVIADLPVLLQNLRVGMTLLGLVRSAQEAHVKIISDTLADAFMSKTQAIADGQIQALAKRLANLEDYATEDSTEDLPLDAKNIEDLLGIDASELDVVNSGGGTASPVMMEWARELALGSWFTLNYTGRTTQVQYVWRSPLGHLHLFANTVGHKYLIQSIRLAGYLQVGLLEPQEEEALTVRATRNALGKIEANPRRLLG